MLADPSVTRETVAREVASLLATPVEDLDADAMRRLSMLLRAPEQLRVPLPAAADSHYLFEDLGLLRRHPASDLKAADVYAQGRLHVLSRLDPEVLVAELRAKSSAGEPIDGRLAASLLEEHPDLLAKAGVDPWELHDQTLELLARGRLSTRDMGDRLELVRLGLQRTQPGDDVQRAMRDDLLELVERNIARTKRERTDTFSNHPDYAEVGRIAENGKLLRALNQAIPAHAPTHATPAHGEAIPW
jgi:hypothetical protein